MISLIRAVVNGSRPVRPRAAMAFVALLLIAIATLCPHGAALAKTTRRTPQHRLYDAIEEKNAAHLKEAVRNGARVNPTGKYSALMLYCGEGTEPFDPKFADLLVALGVDVSAQNHGETALDLACSGASEETLQNMVTWFLAHGAHADGYEGCRPLNALASRNYDYTDSRYEAEAAETLIAHGAQVNVVDVEGNTPLLNACTAVIYNDDEPGHICMDKLARVLIEHGADVNKPNQNGMTPLMGVADIAEKWRPQALQIARDLLAHGARTDLKNKQGATALQIARKSYFAAMVRLLEAHGRNR